MPKSIFDNINTFRKIKGITYRELSEKSGLHIQTVFGLKRRDNVSTKVISALADALGVSVDQLLGRESLDNEPKALINKVPVWEKNEFEKNTKIIRYISVDYGIHAFGILVGPSEGYPRGTIMYFDPDIQPKTDSIIFIKHQEEYLIKRYIVEGDKIFLGNLKYDLFDQYSDFEIIGVCRLITTDLFYSLLDQE